MFASVYEIFLFLILLSILLLALIWNYKVFLRIYTFQVLLILSVFFMMNWDRFLDEKFLALSFIFAVIIRLILIPVVLHKFINGSKLPVLEREFKFW